MNQQITCTVFLLTSEWEDTSRGHVLRYYGRSPEKGAVEITFDDQKPVCFLERSVDTKNAEKLVARKPVELQNFAGKSVDALYFSSYRGLRNTADLLRAAGTPPFESDVRPDRRFLMERFIFSMLEASGESRQEGNLLRLHNPTIKAVDVEPQFIIASLDIETGRRNSVIYSIAVHLSGFKGESECTFVVGNEADIPDEGIFFVPSEKQLLVTFFKWLSDVDPDFIIGWNVIGFDLMMMEKRSSQLGVPFALGRSRRPASLRKNEFAGFQANVSGRVVIDGPQALRASFYNFEDFRLSTVAHELVGEEKLIDADTDRMAEIERLYAEDKVALARYNIQDCRLVTRIFEKVGLLELYARRSQISGMLPGEIGRSVAAFDHYMLPLLHRRGIVAPDKQDVHGTEHAAGGYVMEPTPGIYKNVAVLDFKSLYPSIIQTFCIDPYSRLNADINTLETPTGFRFSRTEHILPQVIDKLLEQRSYAKKANDGALSQAIKILMNSFYGVMGSFGCRFYHPDLPSAITSTGQWLLKGCRSWLEERGFQVLYGDTDSVFVLLPESAHYDPEKVGRELAADLNNYWRKTMSARGLTSYLEMEFEKVYSTFVLPLARGREGGARKRYAGLRGSGADEKIEFVGMEYVRSDWTPLAKQFQYDLYLKVMSGEDVRSWLKDFVRRLMQGELDELLIYRKRLKKPVAEYTRNISPQVRAAKMLKKPGREVKYLMTRSGPVPIQLKPSDPDYQHYLDKQIRPLADSLLGLQNTSLQDLIGPEQLSLF